MDNKQRPQTTHRAWHNDKMREKERGDNKRNRADCGRRETNVYLPTQPSAASGENKNMEFLCVPVRRYVACVHYLSMHCMANVCRSVPGNAFMTAMQRQSHGHPIYSGRTVSYHRSLLVTTRPGMPKKSK